MVDLIFTVMEFLLRIFTTNTTAISFVNPIPISRRTQQQQQQSLLEYHTDLLETIAAKVTSLEDHIRFGAACRSWRLAALSARSNLDFPTLTPWLMLAVPSRRRGFYSPATGEVFRLELPPEMTHVHCWGSPYGWVFARFAFNAVFLFNPISRSSIRIRSPFHFFVVHHKGPSPFPKYKAQGINYLLRAVLTANPNSPDCIVFIIYTDSRRLAYLRPGDRDWTAMEDEEEAQGWSDIIYFKGCLFGCLCDGRVFLVSGSTTVEFAAAPDLSLSGSDENHLNYLVDLGGELCLVVRYYTHISESHAISCPTVEFKIYKLDIDTRSWERVMSLGDKCVFVGANYSHSIRASSAHLRPNCVYFSDDYSYYQRSIYKTDHKVLKVSDMGIYDVGKGQVAAFTMPLSVEQSEIHYPMCPPLWITPTLN